MIRVTHVAWKIAVSVPTFLENRVGASALPSVSPSEFSRHDDPVEIAALGSRARGMTNLAGCAVGRRLTYWSNPGRSPAANPRALCRPGRQARLRRQRDRIESRRRSSPSFGIIAPCFL